VVALIMGISGYNAGPAAKPPNVTVVMVGDILLHDRVEQAAANDDGSYNFDFIFDGTRDYISSADLAIVNQEVIIGGKELGISGYPAFNAPEEIGDALVGAGFDVVCHATNHALDKGKKGIINTLSYWESAHPEMTVLGINMSQEDRDAVTIVEKNGIRIALLNYTYGTNGISFPKDMPYAVDMLDEERIRRDLEYAEANADFTIVCPHWGTEYNLDVDSSQKKWTKIFREGGADLVIGTHPHVIEPVEFIEDEVPGHSNNHGDGDMLVYYSLGNFVNWTSGTGSGTTNRMVGGIAQISLAKDTSGEVYVSENGVKAVVCHVSPEHQGVKVYPLSEYSEDLAQKSAILVQDGTFSRERCVELCNKVWGSSWY
jgi:poly-gamma-glutamate synthesis protein (capsule biosynthesis protein)